MSFLGLTGLTGCSGFTYPSPGPSRIVMGLENAVEKARLAPCPTSPNCVCTYEQDQEHGIVAFTFTKTPDEVMAGIESTLLENSKV